MVDAMIASAGQEPAPLRLALGSDAYLHITTALSTRLEQLERQGDLARSTDSEFQGKSPQWFPSAQN